MKESVYVCHTYYHVYVTFLKEFAKPKEEQGHATVILSKMSTDFESLAERLKKSGYFKDVLEYDEKNFMELPEVKKYNHPSRNPIAGIWNRFLFTKKYGKAQEKYIPTDLKKFDEIYVYCDSDPIGYYLNYKHIYYHSLEDGLDTTRRRDHARVDNENHFDLKVFLSKKCNIIFIQNGFGRYCLDFEVNDNSVLEYPNPYRIECSRAKLAERLTSDEKQLLLKVFVKQYDELVKLLDNGTRKRVLILTEPLCDLDTRKRIFTDLIDRYKDEYSIILKQHPRDELDYEANFPGYVCVDRTVPMEMLNLLEGFRVDLVVGVFTELGNILFADEKLSLGPDFLDDYEDISMHDKKFTSY